MKKICILGLCLCFILSCSDGVKHVTEVQKKIETHKITIKLDTKTITANDDSYDLGNDFSNIECIEFTAQSDDYGFFIPKDVDKGFSVNLYDLQIQNEIGGEKSIVLELPLSVYYDPIICIYVKDVSNPLLGNGGVDSIDNKAEDIECKLSDWVFTIS